MKDYWGENIYLFKYTRAFEMNHVLIAFLFVLIAFSMIGKFSLLFHYLRKTFVFIIVTFLRQSSQGFPGAG